MLNNFNMELSEFLNTRKPFPSLPDDYKESAEWEESQYFNAWIKKYPECKHEEIIERLKYIRSYTIHCCFLILTVNNGVHHNKLPITMIIEENELIVADYLKKSFTNLRYCRT